MLKNMILSINRGTVKHPVGFQLFEFAALEWHWINVEKGKLLDCVSNGLA